MSKPLFFTNFFEQRKTIEGLIKESRTDFDYYLFIVFGAFITTLGLLIDNPVVIVGAMLVAPILFPILALGMGIVTASGEAIGRSIKNLGKTLVLIIVVSAVTAFLINKSEITGQLSLASTPNFLFFLIAFFSGVVASYAWVKQSLSSALPGVAITVALLPPLSAFGVSMTLLERDIFSGSALLVIINLLGIILASVVVFSLFGFSSLSRIQEAKIEEEKAEIEEQKEESEE